MRFRTPLLAGAAARRLAVLLLAVLPAVTRAADKLPEHNTIIAGPWQATPEAEQRKQAALEAAAREAAAISPAGPTAVPSSVEKTALSPPAALPVPNTLPAAELQPRDQLVTVGPPVLNDNERRKLHELQRTPVPEKRE